MTIAASSSDFRTRSQLGLFHWPDQLRAAATPSTAFEVYVFRFSQEKGMSIYVNGGLLGEEPEHITPVVGFSSAQIGALGGTANNVGRRVRITGLKGIARALTLDEIQQETDRLRIKYGI